MVTTPPEPTSHAQVGVGAVAVEDGRILLIRRGRPPYAGRWSIPGGKLLFAETVTQAIVREMKEETSLDVEVGDLAGILESIHESGQWHYVIIDHFVTVIGGVLEPRDDAVDARWFPIEEVPQIDTTPLLLESLRRFGVIP